MKEREEMFARATARLGDAWVGDGVQLKAAIRRNQGAKRLGQYPTIPLE
jgi:hypothetical protein